MSTQEISLSGIDDLSLILHTVYGSEVHHINYGDASDRDEVAIYVPTIDEALSLQSPIELYRYRSAYDRRGEEDYHTQPRSQKGDLDFNVYEVRHWSRIALTGSPFILAPLFVDEEWIISETDMGTELRENWDRFMSRSVITKSIGYMKSQYERMMGIRSNRVSRPELVDAHGYDTKFAAHMIRIGIQARKVVAGKGIEIPVNPVDAAKIRSVRAGEVEQDEVVAWYHALYAELSSALDEERYFVPEEPDYAWVNDWAVRAIRNQ